MERTSSLPDPVVVGQDDQTELHVQAVIQSGRRHLDVRVWRKGPAGFAPSRTGVTLEARDLTALREGISELLQASDDGHQVARVVWDAADGQRLRAETEPFGTRYLARLGFWQRVRNTWKPVDDGLVLAADQLKPLQAILDRFRPWVEASAGPEPPPLPAPGRQMLDRWPPPGADWLTVEPDRVALHPRGVRLTCTVTEVEGWHRIELRQWKREDTLWLPEPVCVSLAMTDLDSLLACLSHLTDAAGGGTPNAAHELRLEDGSTLHLTLAPGDTGPTVLADQSSGGTQGGFERRFTVPASYLPNLGRAVAQSWYLLAGWLSEAERAALQKRGEQAGTPARPETPVEEVPQAAAALPEEEPIAPSPVGQTFSFGAESETPGFVLPEQDGVRILVEGYMLPHAIRMPAEIVARVVVGLDELNSRRRRQTRIDPMLLCDRPDCAVYGRAGTNARPDAVELRVWSGPTTSESISFEGAYLPDLIDGLRRYLRLAGLPVPPMPAEIEPPAVPPAPLPQPSSPARMRPVAPASPLEAPGPLSAAGTPEVARVLHVPLGGVTLGEHQVSMTLQGHSESPQLQLRWDGHALELPVADLEELLADVRSLYYDALRGRRGRSLSVGHYPLVTVGIQSHGPELECVLRQEADGEISALTFPAREVPTFLNAARAALKSS